MTHDELQRLLAKAWSEGELHESTYLDHWGQFCPNGEKCNPYIDKDLK